MYYRARSRQLGADVIGGAAVTGGGIPYTQALGPISSAASIAFTLAGKAPPEVKAISVGTTVAATAAAFIPIVGPVVSLGIGILGKFLPGWFGIKPELTHAQREARETARYAGQWQGMVAEIQTAQTPEDLHRILTRWGSGYTGGVTPAAVSVDLKGQAVGTSSAVYGNVLTDPAEFWRRLVNDPASLHVGVQAGIAEGLKTGPNAAIRNAILTQARRIYQERAAAPKPGPGGVWFVPPGREATTLPPLFAGTEANEGPTPGEALSMAFAVLEPAAGLQVAQAIAGSPVGAVARLPGGGYVLAPAAGAPVQLFPHVTYVPSGAA